MFATVEDTVPATDNRNIGYGTVVSYPQVLFAAVVQGPGAYQSPTEGLIAFYVARILAGLIVLAPLLRLVYLRWASVQNTLLLLLGFSLLPLFVQQSFSVSADVVCTAFTLWLLVIVINANNVNKWDLFFVNVFAAMACVTKPTMIALAVCSVPIYMWKRSEFGRPSLTQLTTKQMLILLGMICLLAVSVAFWMFRKYQHDVYFFFGHLPLAFNVISEGFLNRFRQYNNADTIGSLDLFPSRLTRLYWGALVVMSLFVSCGSALRRVAYSKKRFQRNLIEALGLWFSGLVYALVTGVAMYCRYHDELHSFLEYLQPRYFFPTVLFFLAGCHVMMNRASVSEVTPPLRPRSYFIAHIIVVGIFLVCVSSMTASLVIDIASRYW